MVDLSAARKPSAALSPPALRIFSLNTGPYSSQWPSPSTIGCLSREWTCDGLRWLLMSLLPRTALCDSVGVPRRCVKAPRRMPGLRFDTNPRAPISAPRPMTQSGLSRVPSTMPIAARVTARLAQLASPIRAITAPPAITSPTVTGARPRLTIRCHGASRNRSHQRYPAKHSAQDGPNVASPAAAAAGRPPTFQPMKLVSRIMFGPGIACTTAKQLANSRSVSQPLAPTTKLRRSGKAPGMPPKLISEISARYAVSARLAPGGWVIGRRFRTAPRRC